MVSEFEYGGRKVNIWSITGEVTGAHKRSETHVSSSGGGGYVGSQGGYVSAPTVSSTVIVKQEFFVKDANGRQTPVQLAALDIPITDGQRVTLIGAGDDDAGRFARLVNHSAGLYWRIGGSYQHAKDWGLLHRLRYVLPIGIGIWILLGEISSTFGFLGTAGFWGYEFFHARRVTKRLGQHLDGQARQVLTAG